MNNKPNYSKGNRREIVYLLLNLGILPYPAIKVLSKSDGALNRTHQTICAMEKEGLVERRKLQKTRYGSRFLALKDFDKNKSTLTEYIAKECIDFYQSSKSQLYTTWTDSNAKGIRKINEAYLGAMMYGAGYDTFVDQSGSDRKYYSSKELKNYLNYGDDVSVLDGSRKVNFTKGFGVATSKGGNYMTYMTWHDTLPKLSDGEHKLKNMSYGVIRQVAVNKEDLSGLIFMNNLQKLANSFDMNTSYKASYTHLMNILKVFPSLYILPYSIEGRKHFEIMSQAMWKEKLIKEATDELQDTKTVNYNCHHYDRNTGVGTLVFCVPDIGMLFNFYLTALKAKDRHKFRIICFDYQLKFVKDVCKDVCDIYSTSLNDYYDSVKGESYGT